MKPSSTQGPMSAPSFSPRRERALLYARLFTAAGALVQQTTLGGALQWVCDTLVDASEHVLTAWVYTMAPRDRERIDTIFTAGPVPEAMLHFRRVEDFDDCLAPQTQQGQQVRRVWLGPSDAPMGGLGVAVDRSDYFDRVGTEPIALFGKVAGRLLEQAQIGTQLRTAAEKDALTGVLSRSAVRGALDHVHARAERQEASYALLLVDLDGFKSINDTYGHLVGDRVLGQVANRLRQTIRIGDWIGRWGGDEFLAVLPDTEADEAQRIAERARALIRARPFRLGPTTPIRITVSAGLACYPLDGPGPPRLIGLADAALCEAKAAGRDDVRRPTARVQRLHTMAGRITEALESNLIQAAYQPIVDLVSGNTVGYEALARLLGAEPQAPVVDAEEFIEVASRRHLIHHIDFTVFCAALHHCDEERSHGTHSLYFVNISAGLLRQPNLIASLAKMVAEQQKATGWGYCPIVLEITERDFVDSRQALAMLKPLIEQGARLALDDFGSGYASFRYLADLPVEFLKIEGLLVRQATSTAKSEAIVRGIRDVADELGVTTLAEGIEDAQTANLMRAMDIGLGQGRYFGPPRLDPGIAQRKDDHT